jgi:hypothetical protein
MNWKYANVPTNTREAIQSAATSQSWSSPAPRGRALGEGG